MPENVALDMCGDEGGVFVSGPSGRGLGVGWVRREGRLLRVTLRCANSGF